MAELPLDKVLEFLKRVRPFSELPESTLRDVARTLLIDYFPKGDIVLSPETTEPPYLYLVFSGVARCYGHDRIHGETLRYVSEKDHFGGENILTGQCTYSAQVVEDMICYLIKPEVFKNLEENFEGFRQYFRIMTDTLTAQIWDWMESHESAPPRSWREKMRVSQFRTSIDTLISRAPVCCSPTTTVSEIARVMSVSGVGSVIIVEEENPVGIITKNDLTEKILARKRGSDVPAGEIMSGNLVSMNHTGSCFEASLQMLENHCRHMVAVKDGALYGVISQYDLILLQGANPLAVVGAIDKQDDIGGIQKCVRDMSVVQQALLAEGGRIEDIWALMTSFRDTLTRRLLVLAIEEMRKQGQEPP
ncbi:MAG: CBS domain-containing protein, partial [Deltaproteobacteria bacterium]|nr:CBS domain-containing protein [Deltaproteobacteria bacterium]